MVIAMRPVSPWGAEGLQTGKGGFAPLQPEEVSGLFEPGAEEEPKALRHDTLVSKNSDEFFSSLRF
jgi:hypothetical protein